MSSNKFRQAALAAARRGWHVFPCHPESKRPAIKQWEQQATIDEQQIHQWWPDYSRKNIGIATGPSGLLVVDLDQPKTAADVPPEPWNQPGIRNGLGVLCALASRAGEPLPATFTVGTPSGGTHLYFTQPPGHQLHNSAGRLGWKIDTRGHGGYVVASGSVVNGTRYRTECGARPAPLPGWITAALTTEAAGLARRSPEQGVRDSTAYAQAALRAELERVLSATEGSRNHTLNAAAYSLGQLTAAGQLDRDAVESALLAAAAHIGLGTAEAARTIESGLTAGARQPRTCT